MIMSNSLNWNTGDDCEILSLEQLETVNGGRVGGGIFGDKVVIIGCTTPTPPGGYPPGTVVWNPAMGPFRAPVWF